jgi:hypothetical protein
VDLFYLVAMNLDDCRPDFCRYKLMPPVSEFVSKL